MHVRTWIWFSIRFSHVKVSISSHFENLTKNQVENLVKVQKLPNTSLNLMLTKKTPMLRNKKPHIKGFEVEGLREKIILPCVNGIYFSLMEYSFKQRKSQMGHTFAIPLASRNILLTRGRLKAFFGAHNLRAFNTSLIFRMGFLIPSMRFGPMHGVHVYKNSNYKSIHVLSHPISRF